MQWPIIQQMNRWYISPRLPVSEVIQFILYYWFTLDTVISTVEASRQEFLTIQPPDKKKELCRRWQIVTSVYVHVLLHFCLCETISAQYFYVAGLVVFGVVSGLFEILGVCNKKMFILRWWQTVHRRVSSIKVHEQNYYYSFGVEFLSTWELIGSPILTLVLA